MPPATIFPITQRSTSGKFRRFTSSSYWLLYAKAVFAISFFVLSAAAVPSRSASSTIPPNTIQPNSAPSPSTNLSVIPFQYLTTYVSACDGRVSIGPSSGPERTPAALVTLGLRGTGYSVKIRWNWKQKLESPCSPRRRPATSLTYPLATMKVSSASQPTWQGVSLPRLGRLHRPVLPAIRPENPRRSAVQLETAANGEAVSRVLGFAKMRPAPLRTAECTPRDRDAKPHSLKSIVSKVTSSCCSSPLGCSDQLANSSSNKSANNSALTL